MFIYSHSIKFLFLNSMIAYSRLWIFVYHRFHSLHHTRFRTNYSLFMPIYDYIYGTEDESSDETYETSLKKPKDSPDVVHLTHLTTPDSIYHLPSGLASLSSNPETPKWYLCLMRPFTFGFIAMAWIFGRTFVSERNSFKNLNLQSWVIPRFTEQVRKFHPIV